MRGWPCSPCARTTRPLRPRDRPRTAMSSAIVEWADATRDRARRDAVQRRRAVRRRGRHGALAARRCAATTPSGEYYLTDVVALARGRGRGASPRSRRRSTSCAASTPAPSWPRPRRWCRAGCAHAAMEAGVTMTDPASVFLCADTELGAGRHDRPERGVRPGRHGRARGGDPRLQPSRGLHHRPAAQSSARSPACGPARSWARACISAISSR